MTDGKLHLRRGTAADDPAHAWVRASWAEQRVDPRLPMSGPRGSR